MSEKPKCDEIGFKHCWYVHSDTDTGLFETRTCENCGKREIKKVEWVDWPYDEKPMTMQMEHTYWKDR